MTWVELAQLRQRVDAAVIMVTYEEAEAQGIASEQLLGWGDGEDVWLTEDGPFLVLLYSTGLELALRFLSFHHC